MRNYEGKRGSKRGGEDPEEREREKWSHWVSVENHQEQETQAHHTNKLWAQVGPSLS